MTSPLVDPRRPWLAERARFDPGAPALCAGAEQLTVGELADRAARIAADLARRGVGRGARVFLRGETTLAVVATLHAIEWLGATAVVIDPRLTAGEAEPLVDRAAPALTLDPAELERLAAVGVAPLDPVLPEPADVHTILFTSGTTGTPKGAMLTYGNHFASALASRARLGRSAGDRWLLALPLHHVGGLSIRMRSIVDGAAVVLHERFEAAAVDRAIREQRVTLISLVSTALRRLLEAAGEAPFPPGLRAVLLGGGPLAPALVTAGLSRGLPLFPTYGLTETASQVATASPGDALRKPGSVGRPVAGTEIRLDRPDGEGRGEILVRGPTTMRGYFRDPAATREALRDGWLATGDVGRLDADGDLWIEDRRSDLIVSGGENVYPAEVEAALASHPAVVECAVYGEPDPEWGQRVVAAIVSRGRAPSLEELRTHGARSLARFKLPRALRLVADLPRTASGKIRRHRLRS